MIPYRTCDIFLHSSNVWSAAMFLLHLVAPRGVGVMADIGVVIVLVACNLAAKIRGEDELFVNGSEFNFSEH